MKDTLVREEDGSIRWCDRNITLLGYWWVVKHYYTREYLGEILADATSIIVQGVQALLLLTLLPIVPFVRAYFSLKQAKERVEYETNLKGGSE